MTTTDAIRAREARMRERHRPAPTRDELVSMKKAELVEMADARGVPSSGTKAELVERLAWR